MRTDETARTAGWFAQWSFALDGGLIVLAVFVATVVRLGLAHLVGSAIPFVTYFIAAILLSWFRGFWPAALCILLGSFAGAHFVLDPKFSPTLLVQSQNAAIIGFLGTALTVSFMIDFQRRTSRRAVNAEKMQASIARQNASLLAQAQQSQEELQRSNVELTRANRDLEIFAYSTTHDLREPLRNVAIFAELLQNDRAAQPPDASGQQYLAHVLSGAQRANTWINDLLAYMRATKIDNGPIPSVDASEVLAEVIQGMRGQIEAAGATVSSTSLPSVRMHRICLVQVLQNLIGNSLKYRRDEAPLIRVSAVSEEESAVFSVADNGIGLEPEFAEHIFGLFKRLHTADAYPGNGIGLAICRRLVEHHDGRIWLASSQRGVGSTFRFSLAAGQPRT